MRSGQKFGGELDELVKNSKIKSLRCCFGSRLFLGVAKNGQLLVRVFLKLAGLIIKVCLHITFGTNVTYTNKMNVVKLMFIFMNLL
jgi:hypothetical protein